MDAAITNETNCMLIISKGELSNLIYTEVCKALAEHEASIEESTTNESESNMLTTDDVCNILRITKTTLWRWNRAKYLCPVKIGARKMYNAKDVYAIIK